MYVVCVSVHVVDGRANEFVAATLENAAGTRAEPGNVRFDVLRASDGASRFFLYEVYREEADFVAHQMTAHYLRWKEAVAPLMASPRVGVKYASISPEPWE
jgi:autoinducer 2-degrading protein